MSLRNIYSFLIVFILLISCNKQEKIDIENATLSFINRNEDVIGFGKMNYKSILDKIEYKSIPKLGKILDKEVIKLSNSLNINKPVYYVVQTAQDGQNTNFYAFFEITNQDSLVDRLGSMGFFVEEYEKMHFMKDGDVTIGMQGNIGVAIIKQNGYDHKKELKDIFHSIKETPQKGAVINELIAKKGDITYISHLENSTKKSSKAFSDLTQEKQAKLKELFKNSFVHTSLNFEKGKITVNSENFFSSSLSNVMFMKGKNNANLVEKMGKGKALAGISVNIDIVKFEAFVDNYFPEVKKQLFKNKPEIALSMMLLGDNPLSKFSDGKAAAVMVGDLSNIIMGFTPEINFYAGIGNKSARPLWDTFLSQYTDKLKYSVTDFEVTGQTTSSNNNASKLILPDCAKNFGRHGITGFLDVKAIHVESMGLPKQLKSLELIDNLQFSSNDTKSEFIIEFIRKDQNVLKQVADMYVDELTDAAGKVSF